MKARDATLLCILCALGAMLSCTGGTSPAVLPKPEPAPPTLSQIGTHVLPETRRVEVDAQIVVSDLPAKAKRVQIWVPFPAGSRAQAVLEPIIESPAAYRPIIRLDANYDSPSIFLIVDEPLQGKAEGSVVPLPKEVRLRYTVQVERRRINDAERKPGDPDSIGTKTLRKEFAADLKLPTTPKADEAAAALEADALSAALAAVPAAADNTPLARARAIYDHVVATFEPDNAPAARPLKEVLESKRGNALDYAQATVALMRAAGIPARIESGLALPEDRTAEAVELKDRGAWVSFYANGSGWTSCDPYLADRFGELKDYLFAGLDANRVGMSVGPAPALMPPPDSGVPLVLNDVIAEADGKPIPATMTLTFRDVCPK